MSRLKLSHEMKFDRPNLKQNYDFQVPVTTLSQEIKFDRLCPATVSHDGDSFFVQTYACVELQKILCAVWKSDCM